VSSRNRETSNQEKPATGKELLVLHQASAAFRATSSSSRWRSLSERICPAFVAATGDGEEPGRQQGLAAYTPRHPDPGDTPPCVSPRLRCRGGSASSAATGRSNDATDGLTGGAMMLTEVDENYASPVRSRRAREMTWRASRP